MGWSFRKVMEWPDPNSRIWAALRSLGPSRLQGQSSNRCEALNNMGIFFITRSWFIVACSRVCQGQNNILNVFISGKVNPPTGSSSCFTFLAKQGPYIYEKAIQWGMFSHRGGFWRIFLKFICSFMSIHVFFMLFECCWEMVPFLLAGFVKSFLDLCKLQY